MYNERMRVSWLTVGSCLDIVLYFDVFFFLFC